MVDGRATPGFTGRTGAGARGVTGVALCAVLVFAVLVLIPAGVFAADLPPHVTPDEGPDSCAMCHRSHSAPGVVARSQLGTWETTSSALVLADPSSNSGDAALCLTCHGVDALGSGIDVQSDFAGVSVHSMLPDDSLFEGVPPKQCSSCHDSHGVERRGDGTPYPGLLRASTEDGDLQHSGEEYCATCHFEARETQLNRFDGLPVYEKTAHARMPGPAFGTEITCSNCHASHGSDIAPLIRSEITTPAASAPATVTANDRTLCYACHAEAQATWLGGGVYDDETTQTVHGASDVALPLLAEYALRDLEPSEETTRLAGECQSCHNPMGSDDGTGGPVAKLAELEGRELCYSCHNADNAAEITDMASWGVRPENMLGEPELVVAWDPENLPGAYGGLHVHTRAFGDDEAPYDLEGPRRYRVANGMDGRTGAMAYGDIDASGATALVVADPAAPVVRVFRSDPLAGLAYNSHPIAEPAAFIEIGEFIADGSGRPELAVVSVETAGASYARIYRSEGSGLNLVAGPTFVGDNASGLASGNLTGGAVADLVVTALTGNPLGPGELRTLSAAGGTLVSSGPYATLRGPRGPSIGNVWLASSETTEIVVANSGETIDALSVFSAAGAPLGSYEATITPGGAVAWDTAIGNVLPGVGTVEVAVALRSETSASGVSVFRTEPANGLVNHATYETGSRFATSSLEIGDVDGDGAVQLVVGNAGVLSRTPGDSVSSSVQAFSADGAGTSMSVTLTRWGGGAELAGGSPAVAVVDLGPVGRSRHPASAVEGAHVSTETAGFERHAECVDCHNVHAATAEVRDSLEAPAVYGVIRGTWGTDVSDDTLVEGIENEYELCFKCHATGGESPRDIAAEFSLTSAHPVMGPSAQTYCVDCHGNAGAGPVGPHVSSAAPLLVAPLSGAPPSDGAMLCFDCHDAELYRDGTAPAAGTGFRDVSVNLHQLHVASGSGHGLGCESCHASHGSANEFLIRAGLGWVVAADGGQCTTECHTPPTYSYSRSASPWTAQASGVTDTLRDVQFVSSSLGWIVGDAGRILRTTNGGVTWTVQASGTTESLTSLSFINASNGWVVGATNTIRVTTDGGTAWAAQAPGNPRRDWNSVDFVNATTGWVVANNAIRRTTNGGTTWVNQPPGNPARIWYGVDFVSTTTGWVVGTNGTIRVTTTSGAAWNLQTSGVTVILRDVHFLNSSIGWIVGDGGTILRTTNGGATWTSQTIGTANLYGVHFIDANSGWVVGAGGVILKTTNGGASWTVETSGTTADLEGVSFVDVKTGWAVGAAGTIRHYNVIP